MKYECPYCGKIIEEVSILEFTWRKTGVACGLGIGCGLLVWPLACGSWPVGVVGAFIIGFIVAFLLMRGKAK